VDNYRLCALKFVHSFVLISSNTVEKPRTEKPQILQFFDISTSFAAISTQGAHGEAQTPPKSNCTHCCRLLYGARRVGESL